jgi:hypothetical protein
MPILRKPTSSSSSPTLATVTWRPKYETWLNRSASTAKRKKRRSESDAQRINSFYRTRSLANKLIFFFALGFVALLFYPQLYILRSTSRQSIEKLFDFFVFVSRTEVRQYPANVLVLAHIRFEFFPMYVQSSTCELYKYDISINSESLVAPCNGCRSVHIFRSNNLADCNKQIYLGDRLIRRCIQ